MKSIIFFLALASLVSTANTNVSNEDKCRTILDSAKVLVETGDFSLNWEPRIKNKERQAKISKWFETRSFSELICLLKSSNKSHNFYGYLLAVNFHRDSLKNRYSELLNDTTSVQLNAENGLVDLKMTMGKALTLFADELAEEDKAMNRRPDVEKSVALFIREYSSYPTSYKPISFPYFSIGSDNRGLSNFNIRHHYEIKNNHGQTVNIVSAFILDPNLNINVIEPDSSRFISSYPPRLKDWFTDYGRHLDHDDSIKLKYNQTGLSTRQSSL